MNTEDALSHFEGLKVLNVSLNSLTGPMPKWFKMLADSLQELNIAYNRFTGTIDAIKDLVKLKDLRVSTAGFNGTIGAVKDLHNLEQLRLLNADTALFSPDSSQNYFTGHIDALSGLTKLFLLNMASNGFSGPLDALALLIDLEYVNLRNNSLTGPIGPLKELTSLKGLLLDKNDLTGNINVLKQLTSLCCWIDGGKPALHLESNRFTGPIDSIYNLHRLTGLNLSNNSFSGTVGDGLSKRNMPNLTYIDLSVNDFTAVPSNLVDWSGFTGGCNLRQEAFTCSHDTRIPAAAETNCGASCCSGSSAALGSRVCAAWQDLFDATSGESWIGCSDSRQDPCACGGSEDCLNSPCLQCDGADITRM
jgi:hypothetical protein